MGLRPHALQNEVSRATSAARGTAAGFRSLASQFIAGEP